MNHGNRIGLVIAAIIVMGAVSPGLNAADRVVLGEYFTNQF